MSEQSVTWAAQMLESMNEEASKDGSSMSKLGCWITIGDGENCGDGDDNHRGGRDVDGDFERDVDLMKFEFSFESLWMNESSPTVQRCNHGTSLSQKYSESATLVCMAKSNIYM